MAYSDNFSANLVSLVDSMVAADRLTFSEMLYETAFEQSNIADTHNIVTNVRKGHKVPILKDAPNVESFPFVDETSCDTQECDLDADFANMEWDLGLMECRVPICLRSFDENFLRFFNTWRQTQEGTPDLDSAMINFITRKFNENLQIAKWRGSYFGDTSSASAYYNGFDGFFAQAEATPELIVDIAANDGLTFTEQKALTGEQVYNLFIEMYDRASEEPWFDEASLEFRATRTMTSKLVTWLNKLGKNAPMNCECIDPNQAVARNVFTRDGLTINGIPVLTHNELDTIINNSTELNGGGADNPRVNPHRAILTFRENMLIGTSQTEALESFDIWYDKTDKKVYVEGSAYIGSAIPLKEYILAI